MATGVLAPPALALDSVGVAELAEAVIPEPTDPAWKLAPVPLAGGFDELADPRPDAFAKNGWHGHVHDLAVRDRIHVIPRRRDLGAVLSEQEFEVEVWNAYLERAQILSEITIEGPAGIEVDDPEGGFPDHFPSSDSQIFVVRVLAEGDPLVDNVVTWIFTGLDSSGSTLTITGFRLIPFPFDPDWSQPVTEDFGYLTDIIESYRGNEQRIQLRKIPIGTIGYSVVLTALRDAQMANAILFGNQARVFGVARWQFRIPLAADAHVDDLEVLCDPSNLPFEVGGLLLLWTDPYHWEVQTIASVEADRIVLASALQNEWAAGTAILPLVVGRLSADEGFTWESLKIGSAALVFSIDGFKP